MRENVKDLSDEVIKERIAVGDRLADLCRKNPNLYLNGLPKHLQIEYDALVKEQLDRLENKGGDGI